MCPANDPGPVLETDRSQLGHLCPAVLGKAHHQHPVQLEVVISLQAQSSPGPAPASPAAHHRLQLPNRSMAPQQRGEAV